MPSFRKVYLSLFGVVWMAALFVPLFPVLAVWPTYRWRLNVSRTYARWWSRGLLFVAGVRVRLHGREHLATCPAVYTFNHAHMLDFFVNATFAPRNSLVFGKRELLRIPFVGWMWGLGGHPMIQRDDREQWQALMDRIGERLASGRYCTLVAPEGRRSRDGQLLPFKKGPFHLALQSGAPIVPLVLQGVPARVSARDGFRPGVVDVTVLAPIPTVGWSADALDDRVEEVRQAYVEALGRGAPD